MGLAMRVTGLVLSSLLLACAAQSAPRVVRVSPVSEADLPGCYLIRAENPQDSILLALDPPVQRGDLVERRARLILLIPEAPSGRIVFGHGLNRWYVERDSLVVVIWSGFAHDPVGGDRLMFAIFPDSLVGRSEIFSNEHPTVDRQDRFVARRCPCDRAT